jgi:DNA polymerase V
MKYCALVDCNNFYVSCERLFNPALEKRPVIILSNNDGCVVARSQEAKQLGIGMGEPFFKVSDLCSKRDVVVYSSNYQLYGDLSERVMAVLATATPDLEIYSIDEAFLWFPESMSIKQVVETCVRVRQQVYQWVGIPTSIGIAPTKTLAKLATALAKESQKKEPLSPTRKRSAVISLLSNSDWEPILKTTPIRQLWGVGAGLEKRFHGLGIQTAWDLHESDPLLIRHRAGIVGERLLWELHGVNCLPLEKAESRKSITCSRSFGEAVTDPQDLSEALSTHISSACEKLREDGLCATAMQVFALTAIDPITEERNRYGTTISFPTPTNDTPYAIDLATKTLHQWAKQGPRYKKCGVVMFDFVPEQQVSPDLFHGGLGNKRREVLNVVDAINARFGKNTLFYGATGVHPRWQMRCDHRSRRYTTCWDELATVRA